MSDEIARLRAVLEGAIVGPWHRQHESCGKVDLVIAGRDRTGAPGPTWVAGDMDGCDARAIAALGTLWPALIAVAEAAALHSSMQRGTHVRPGSAAGEQAHAVDLLNAAIREHLGDDS